MVWPCFLYLKVFNPNDNGGGVKIGHATCEKCPCLHINNTFIIKTNIPVLYCLSHDKDLKFQFKNKRIDLLTNKEVKQRQYY